ncbi:hypothetical protein [Acaryochloris sp. IP29b_bin.137]|uniref:hypothetical protein n=1 Tax=Acaryochloris sp. IP29b_bin.137 TaxID=2969217 RepID=UPI002610591C|nr:hypothetical protein [Acaryochloris sp. IP29b_bin.137]
MVIFGGQLFSTEPPLSVVFENKNPDEVFNLLISLWMIAWLLESLLEVLLNIFKGQNDGDTKKFTYTVGFLLSLFIAMAGVRTLDVFFTPNEEASLLQQKFFYFIDVVLTAGVLAGGSDSIHQLTQTFRSLVLSVKQSSEDDARNQGNDAGQDRQLGTAGDATVEPAQASTPGQEGSVVNTG